MEATFSFPRLFPAEILRNQELEDHAFLQYLPFEVFWSKNTLFSRCKGSFTLYGLFKVNLEFTISGVTWKVKDEFVLEIVITSQLPNVKGTYLCG